MLERFFLRCLRAPLYRLVLDRRVAVLGRSTRCDFVVSDASVSRKHAKISLGEQAFTVTDLASRNGTFVDKCRVETCMVRPGQIVQFGNVTFAALLEAPGDTEESKEDTAEPNPSVGEATAIIVPRDRLTAAQRRVYDLLLGKLTEKSIARRLHLSPNTVHNHIGAIFQAFGVHSRAELLAMHLTGRQE
jgi:DNA-binding CsgD family transcriptional regulator